MKIFEDVIFLFNGNEYTVRHNKVMRLIAIIEETVTLQELYSGTCGMSKVAKAYSDALNYAGAATDIDEVYASLFGNEGGNARDAMMNLVTAMVPPDLEEPATKPKKKPSTKKKKVSA